MYVGRKGTRPVQPYYMVRNYGCTCTEHPEVHIYVHISACLDSASVRPPHKVYSSDKTRGNHMMSPDFIWFHPGAVSVPTYGSNEI
eukprot:SAG22_NODE_86_length_21440_cov_288.248700_4_plen_86_part_00